MVRSLSLDLRNADDPHLEAWRRWNRAIGKRGDVGVWHDTYVVKRSAVDAIFVNMPAYGLAKATGAVRGVDGIAG